MELNNKLKELRISRNMTQEAVAEHLGVSSQTVSKWERGLLSPGYSPSAQNCFAFQMFYRFNV